MNDRACRLGGASIQSGVGATRRSGVNRDQLRDCASLMAQLVPLIVEIGMDYPDALRGDTRSLASSTSGRDLKTQKAENLPRCHMLRSPARRLVPLLRSPWLEAD